jgi:hypothetical protein
MKLKKKNKRSLINRISLNGLSKAVYQRQMKFADYLGRQTQHWNRNAKITALAIFSLLFGGACIILLIKALSR